MQAQEIELISLNRLSIRCADKLFSSTTVLCCGGGIQQRKADARFAASRSPKPLSWSRRTQASGGESSIAELCRREGVAESLYFAWSKEFLEAGKKRLAGDTARAANDATR